MNAGPYFLPSVTHLDTHAVRFRPAGCRMPTQTRTLKFLVQECKIKLDVKNKAGETGADIAVRRGNWKVRVEGCSRLLTDVHFSSPHCPL